MRKTVGCVVIVALLMSLAFVLPACDTATTPPTSSPAAVAPAPEPSAVATAPATEPPVVAPAPAPASPAPPAKPAPKPRSTQPVEQTVYITRTGSKYHRGSCRYLRQSKIPISKADAIANGYEPCQVCNP